MALTLNSLSTAAGGVAQGYRQGVDTRIARAEEQRAQQAELERLDAKRKQEEIMGVFSKLPSIIEPQTQVPQMGQQGGLPAGSAPPQGGGVLPVSPSGAPQAGPPAPTGGMPQAGPPAPTGGIPEATPPSKREQLAALKREATTLALRNGGLEAAQQVDKYFDMQVRGQMMDYAYKGREALRGNASEAAKLLNTAMELTPGDAGLEFVAEDGKLYMERGGTRRPEPVTGEELEGMIRTRLMDDTNYMEFANLGLEERKQTEVERSNLADEKTEAQIARTNQLKYELEAQFAERGMQVDEANALASLITARANSDRAASLALDALKNGWKTTEIQRVFKDTDEWSLRDAQLLPGAKDYIDANPLAWNQLKSDIAYMQLAQDPDQQISREDAAIVSQILHQFGGIDHESAGIDTFDVGILENGRPAVNYNGRQMYLSPELWEVYKRNNPEDAAGHEEEYRKAQEGNQNPGVIQEPAAAPPDTAPGQINRDAQGIPIVDTTPTRNAIPDPYNPNTYR